MIRDADVTLIMNIQKTVAAVLTMNLQTTADALLYMTEAMTADVKDNFQAGKKFPGQFLFNTYFN